MISIGQHTLPNNVVLAPMAGITDLPFRQIAWEFGAGMVISEMQSHRDDLWHTDKSRLRRGAVAGSLYVVQVAGGDPDQVARAALRHAEDGARIIDINFGCPAKKVCRKAAGSALLSDPQLVEKIMRSTVALAGVPVTAKIRTGPSRDNRNGVEIALRLENAGAKAIFVHGRTRACKFEGKAEYETVSAIKSAIRIPVFANGDIHDCSDAEQVITQTGVDGLMVGRAALGAPWVLGQIARGEPDNLSVNDKLSVMQKHIGAIHQHYGEERGVRISRKHVRWYLDNLHMSRSSSVAFNQLSAAQDQLAFIDNLILREAA